MLMTAQRHPNIVELIRLERRAFAAKLRIARAILNWSQTELANRVGLTQRAVHKLEQGETEPRRATVCAVEEVLRIEGIFFDDRGNELRLTVGSDLIDRPAASHKQKSGAKHNPDRGVTALSPRVVALRG